MGHLSAWCRAVCLAAVLTLAAAQASNVTDDPYVGFIRVSNGRFVDAECREFLFSGWNGWRLAEAAANKFTPPGYSSGQAYIKDLFARARAAGLNVLRFFTEGDADRSFVLMNGPASYNEYAFEGLDFLLNEASQAGIKLIMVPLNLWKTSGVPKFEQWCGSDKNNTIPRPDLDLRTAPLNESERLMTPYAWYVSQDCRQIVKDYFTTLANRRNSITGVLYKEDPVILVWNLLNEPRCKYCGPEAVTSWYHDMAQHMKLVAGVKQMVTTGEEGFYDDSSPFSNFNPNNGNRWGGRTGQDFQPNTNSSNIDFAVIHLWVDNWASTPLDLNFARNWIQSHMEAAQQIGKVLMLEEFGKGAAPEEITSVRDPYFELAYSMVNESLASDGPLRGALFWQWDGYGTGPRDAGSNIRESDSTYKSLIQPFSQQLARRAAELHRSAGGLVAGCTPVPFNGGGSGGGSANGGGAVSSAGRRLLWG